MFSYLGHINADPGEPTPQTYRFRFPNPYNLDYARLVPASDWRDPRRQRDSTFLNSYATVWDAGLHGLPIGSYDVSAELPADILLTRDRANRPIRCRATRLVVAP